MITPPPPLGEKWTVWGERLNAFLVRSMNRLQYLRGGETASDNGILAWSPELNAPAVSRDGEFVALRYGHADHFLAYSTATHAATSANTPKALTYEANPISRHIAVDGTDTSKIVFEHGGTFKIDFSVELQSSNSSAKTVYIWPRINGLDVPFSTMVHTVKDSGDKKVVSRSGIFQTEAGDYLQAMFAVTDTALTIQATGATAFSPASPSVTISGTEVFL